MYLNARAGLNGIIDLRAQTDLERVKAIAEDMLGEARRVGNRWAENRALVGVANVAQMQGDFARPRPRSNWRSVWPVARATRGASR